MEDIEEFYIKVKDMVENHREEFLKMLLKTEQEYKEKQMKETNLPRAEFRIGDKVRLKIEKSEIFTINYCHRGEENPLEVYYSSDGKRFYEGNNLELCSKLVKQKITFWANVYKSPSGYHITDIALSNQEKSEKAEGKIYEYKFSKYFEYETEIEEEN